MLRLEYKLNTYDVVDSARVGPFTLNEQSSMRLDGYHAFAFANMILKTEGGATLPDNAYSIEEDEFYTANESSDEGSGFIVYKCITIVDVTYAGVDLYFSGNSFAAYTKATGPTVLNNASKANGGFNYTNGFMDLNIDGYNTYKNAAQATPEDGNTGTATSITVSEELDAPLQGNRSLLITKSTIDAQGEGVSYDFTIDEGARAKTTELKFTYKASEFYVAGDMGMYIYDIDNDVMLLPSVVDVPVADTAGNYFSTFITSDGANYRLIWHIQTTNILPYTMGVDKVEVGEFNQGVGDVGYWEDVWGTQLGDIAVDTLSVPQSYGQVRVTVRRTGISPNSLSTVDWELSRNLNYTQVMESSPSNLANNIRLNYNYATETLSTINSGTWTAVIDKIEKWISARNINTASAFTEYASNSSTTDADDTTSFVYGMGGSEGVIGNTALTTFRKKRVLFKKAIQATDQFIFETSQTPYASYFLSASYSGVPISFGYSYINTAGGVSIEKVDNYNVDVVFWNTPYGTTSQQWSSANLSGVRWRVRKVSNGNMAEVPPMVRAEYGKSSQQSFTSVLSICDFETKVEDTHNAVTTGSDWKFTAPMDGIYSIGFSMLSNSISWTAGGLMITANLVLNDVNGKFLVRPYNPAAYTNRSYSNGNTTIRLSKGDYISIKVSYGTSGANIGQLVYDYITIERIGN